MGFTPFGSRFKGFNVISSPVEAIRRYDPGTRWINESPSRQQWMKTMLPAAAAIGGGILGGPAGAGAGAGLGTWGAEMGFGEGTEDERRRAGRQVGIRNAAAAVVLSSLFGALSGGGGVETPEGSTAAPATTVDPNVAQLEAAGGMPATTGMEPAQAMIDPNLVAQLEAAGGSPPPAETVTGIPSVAPTTTPRSTMGVSPAMGISGGGVGPTTGGGGVSPTTGGGGSWWGITKKVAPWVIGGGLNIYNVLQQKQMMEDLQEAEEERYEEYLESLNPPEETKEARFQGLKGGILKAAPAARKRRANVMAARGIRGKGAAAPIAETERDVQDAINQAYFNIYGTYNVPGAMPPVSYTPTTGQMVGGQTTDLANLLMMYNLMGK